MEEKKKDFKYFFDRFKRDVNIDCLYYCSNSGPRGGNREFSCYRNSSSSSFVMHGFYHSNQLKPITLQCGYTRRHKIFVPILRFCMKIGINLIRTCSTALIKADIDRYLASHYYRTPQTEESITKLLTEKRPKHKTLPKKMKPVYVEEDSASCTITLADGEIRHYKKTIDDKNKIVYTETPYAVDEEFLTLEQCETILSVSQMEMLCRYLVQSLSYYDHYIAVLQDADVDCIMRHLDPNVKNLPRAFEDEWKKAFIAEHKSKWEQDYIAEHADKWEDDYIDNLGDDIEDDYIEDHKSEWQKGYTDSHQDEWHQEYLESQMEDFSTWQKNKKPKLD
jgi:hypothetical protein